jgi:thiol-disulfide isomerase/thioredoxin
VRLRSLAAVAALVLLAGCAGAPTPEAPSFESRIKVDTPQLRSAKATAGIEDCPRPAADATSDLPDLTLPCLGGGRSVDLSRLAGPTVISLWAQWCGPCRRELPYFQELADTGLVNVDGVDWKETSPSGAIALLAETGATYPQLVDLDGRISDHYRVVGLPGVLFVDGKGAVTFRAGEMRSYDELAGLVRDHTGVDVTGG